MCGRGANGDGTGGECTSVAGVHLRRVWNGGCAFSTKSRTFPSETICGVESMFLAKKPPSDHQRGPNWKAKRAQQPEGHHGRWLGLGGGPVENGGTATANRPLQTTILQQNEIWGSTNPLATQWEHERWWRHLVWKRLVDLDVPSKNRLELFRTGHRNEVHLAERASDSTRLEIAHQTLQMQMLLATWKLEKICCCHLSPAQNTLLDCQQLQTAPHTEHVRSSPSVKSTINTSLGAWSDT